MAFSSELFGSLLAVDEPVKVSEQLSWCLFHGQLRGLEPLPMIGWRSRHFSLGAGQWLSKEVTVVQCLEQSKKVLKVCDKC